MNPSFELHTFARRYCIGRRDYWLDKYAPLEAASLGSGRNGYTDKAYGLFPRYLVLDAILRKVETIDPDELPPVGELAALLIKIGSSATPLSMENETNELAWNAVEQERELFVAEIELSNTDNLPLQEPLPYRRVLHKDDFDKHWLALKKRWNISGDYFYPLSPNYNLSLIAWDMCNIDVQSLHSSIAKFFQSTGTTRMLELREDQTAFQVEASAANFSYQLPVGMAEGYWFTEEHDWVIYCSHEDTITLGGTIAEFIRHRFTDNHF